MLERDKNALERIKSRFCGFFCALISANYDGKLYLSV